MITLSLSLRLITKNVLTKSRIVYMKNCFSKICHFSYEHEGRNSIILNSVITFTRTLEKERECYWVEEERMFSHEHSSPIRIGLS